MDNGIYQITGKQKAATAGTADIVAIARGAGIADSHWVHRVETIVPVGLRRTRASERRREPRHPFKSFDAETLPGIDAALVASRDSAAWRRSRVAA